MIAMSSTGLLSTYGHVPFLLKPIYWLLHKPHVDKIVMENTISQYYVDGKWVLIRAALLTDGVSIGKYRVGEMEMGYTIRRRDVADFIVKQCVQDDKWLGKRPVIVY